ncbi:MAG TPA: HAMP domain-containing histidine kinase [Gammaproteobacteria bacterium]|nr:HAMP domain-containing histidine kinase [Gammaproteobacteria bacterium]HIK70860.1 HAMP domain-containing histidine kinase [Pseudomonadales bacterium]
MKDHAIDIENNRLKTIFDPFVQVDDSDTGRYSGAGLGLAITKRVCHLWVETSGLKATREKEPLSQFNCLSNNYRSN